VVALYSIGVSDQNNNSQSLKSFSDNFPTPAGSQCPFLSFPLPVFTIAFQIFYGGVHGELCGLNVIFGGCAGSRP
jgi:hypothetical protein